MHSLGIKTMILVVLVSYAIVCEMIAEGLPVVIMSTLFIPCIYINEWTVSVNVCGH